MGNIYRKIDGSTDATFCSELRDVLVEKFGEDVTIHNLSNSYLIFSCPHLSNKVVKICRWGLWLGSSHSSGDNMNDTEDVGSHNLYGYDKVHVVVGDNFLFVVGTSNSYGRGNRLVAKTVGGRYITHSSSHSNDHAGNCKTKDTINNERIEFVSFNAPLMCDTNVPYKTTLLMTYIDAAGPSLMMKDDGTPDTIKDLSMSGYTVTGIYDCLVTNNALFSHRYMYSNRTTTPILSSSIVAEF